MNMTQEELGALVGVDRVMISNYEAGRFAPDLWTFMRLCEYLGVCAEWLISGKGTCTVLDGDTGIG